MTRGICRSAGCPNAASATPVDRYPGPGEYCPECGERLEALPAPAAPAAPPRRKRARPFAIVGAAVALAATGAIVAFHPAAIGRPSGDALHVCRSTMGERFTSDLVAAYRAKNADRTTPVEYGGDDCDVRFSATAGPGDETTVGRDALVVVVNPENPLAHLTIPQLRRVLSGEIRNWAQLGRRAGPIASVVPDATTDEGRLLLAHVMRDAHLAPKVVRVASSAEVVALVAGPHGRNLLGIASFSGAVPAKVVRLGGDPPPSALSIAEGTYPLAVAIAVETPGASPPPAAATLARYARSDEGQSIAARDGLVPLKGY